MDRVDLPQGNASPDRRTPLQTATVTVKEALEEAEVALTRRQLEALERSVVAQLFVNRERRAFGPPIRVLRRRAA